MTRGKRTEQVKVLFSDTEKADLQRMAWGQDRSPSELVYHIVCLHLYGHVRSIADGGSQPEGTVGPDSGPKR